MASMSDEKLNEFGEYVGPSSSNAKPKTVKGSKQSAKSKLKDKEKIKPKAASTANPKRKARVSVINSVKNEEDNCYYSSGSDNERERECADSLSEKVNPVVSSKKSELKSTVSEYIPPASHLLEVRTMAGTTFKNLLDSLKSVLNDANLIFSEKGLRLASLDENQRVYVHLYIDASSFDFYHCKKTCVLGVDIEQLHGAVKDNNTNDPLCFIYSEDEPQYLKISFENVNKGMCSEDFIPLMNLTTSTLAGELVYDNYPELDAVTFQKICRYISSPSTRMEIKIIGDKIIFSNADGQAKKRYTITISDKDVQPQKPYKPKFSDKNESNSHASSEVNPVEAHGIFSLKYLKNFAKAANVSPKVKLHLKTGMPLICEYSVAHLGTLKYLLSPLPT